MILFFLWVFFSICVGLASRAKGTSGFLTSFFVSLIFTPLVGILVVIFSKPDDKVLMRQGMKKCPSCAELVKADALKCKHCGSVIAQS